VAGRWIGRDNTRDFQDLSLYVYLYNKVAFRNDYLGLKDADWQKVFQDFRNWLFNNVPRYSEYGEWTPESIAVKNSEVGKNLRDFFMEKNKNCITCQCWENVDNFAYKFPSFGDVLLVWLSTNVLMDYNIDISNSKPIKDSFMRTQRFFNALIKSARVSFIGSCSGLVSVKTIYAGRTSYIDITYKIVNTTSLKSFTGGLLPDLEYDGPAGNWTQTYIWTERIPCRDDGSFFEKKLQSDIMESLNCFPYNLDLDNITLPSNYLDCLFK